MDKGRNEMIWYVNKIGNFLDEGTNEIVNNFSCKIRDLEFAIFPHFFSSELHFHRLINGNWDLRSAVLDETKGSEVSVKTEIKRSESDELVDQIDFGELCDDFVCVSSPYVEATARQLARDILEQREGNRALGSYAISVNYKVSLTLHSSTYTCAYTCTYACTFVHHIHDQKDTHSCMCMCKNTCLYMGIHLHLHMHRHIHANIHLHLHIP